ncbi:MAG: helix-turn-helix domain-containing protein [Rubrivivax sp.]|nr:helix-turn-helix domain-containing protein [Rubrivivax sp.]
MTEPFPDAVIPAVTPPPAGRSAGALLKAAREREGLHLAVLAATIKVAPAKLQALEQDRYEELANATFTRALAQSVCRCLKIDPRPVLALLPQVEAQALEPSSGKLSEPFQVRNGRSDRAGLAWISKPMFAAGGLLLLAALAVGLLPKTWFEGSGDRARLALPTASAPAVAASEPAAAVGQAQPMPASPPPAAAAAASTPALVASAPAVLAAAVAGAAEQVAASAPAASTAATTAGLLRLQASADSWIEVTDAQERTVFSRVLHAGEIAQVDGRPPLRITVGNAGATTLYLRGQAVDLSAHTRVNVARLELR